jgi:DNA repair exonuclease SbcCD ATPase subunit
MAISARSTKNEILEAYKALQKENKALQKENKELQTKASKVSSAPAPKAVKKAAPKSSTSYNSVDAIIGGLQSLKSGLGDSASNLQSLLTQEATQLLAIREEVNQHLGELKSLHGLEEVNDDTLPSLFKQFLEASEAFEADLSGRQDALENELSEKRDAWSKEVQEHNASIKERDAELKQARKRDNEEYNYNLKLERQRAADEYEQGQKSFRKELEEAREQQEKAWADREEGISAQETEFSELTEKVESFEDELAKAVKKAKEEGTNIAKRQAKEKADMQQKEAEGQTRVNELKINSLEETINKQEATIDSLSTQLLDAQKQAQELAVKAIEGASNATSFEAIKEIAMEQAKNTKSK